MLLFATLIVCGKTDLIYLSMSMSISITIFSVAKIAELLRSVVVTVQNQEMISDQLNCTIQM